MPTLPAPPLASPVAPEATLRGGQPVRILLVEDNPLDARLVRDWLRDADGVHFQVQHVDRLSNALTALAEHGADVVLLDLALPDSLGAESFDRLHAAAPEVPVVVMSGLDDRTVALQAVQSGAQDYVVKSHANGEVVERIVRYALERAQWLARERAARVRAELLVDAGDLLAHAGPEPRVILTELATLFVARMARYCTIDLVEEGRLQRVVSVAADAADQSTLDLMQAYPPKPGSPHPAWQALETGQPVVVPEVSDAFLVSIAHDAEHLAAARSLRLHSLVVVPMHAAGRVLGTVQLLRAADSPHDEAAVVQLAQAVADRAAVVLENARLYAELQSALAARNALLATVAHDLRNPLSAMKMLVQVARLQARRLLPQSESAAVTEPLTQADTLSNRMEGFIQELVDAARLQEGHPLALTRTPADLVELVSAAVASQAVLEHPLRLDAPAEVLPVNVDQVRIARVLDNLLSNACKYSPPTDEVEVTVSRANTPGGPGAVVRVMDHGIGIPAQDLPHVFEPYRRASNTQGRVRGTGLGLWGSKHIVEEHGGTIALQSQEGQGTTVTVYLPLDVPSDDTPGS